MKPERDRPSPTRGEAEKVYGFRAALAVLERRPDDIVGIAHARDAARALAPLTSFAATRRLPIQVMKDGELARFAESTHHEGVCLETRPRRYLGAQELGDALVRTKGAALALDRVRNPYNIGAMVRTAAFFRIDALLLGAPAPHPGLPPDSIRVAEGGAEHLLVGRTTDLADTLSRLRQRGVRVVGAELDAETDAIGFPFPRPTILVVGNERDGLAERVRAQCDALVTIVGGGGVESLNVAAATAILVAELARTRPRAPTTQSDPRPPPRRR